MSNEVSQWFHATLTPMSVGMFPTAFYPEKNPRTKKREVMARYIEVTPTMRRVVVVGKQDIASIRIITSDMADSVLVVGKAAGVKLTKQMEALTQTMKGII